MPKILVFIVLTLTSLNLTLAGSYDVAKKYLKENNLKESINSFKEAIEEGDNTEKATLYYTFLKRDQLNDPKELYELIKKNVPQSEYILYAYWQYFNLQSLSSSNIDFFEYLAEKELDKIQYKPFKDNLIESIANNMEANANYDEWSEYKEKIESIKDWQIVGIFENISGMGFDKNYGPINDAKPDAIFKNKYEAGVKWFKAKGYTKGQWLRLGFYFEMTNSIAYAQTFVKSDADRTIKANLGVSGSTKFWLNDELKYQNDEEVNNGQNSFTLKINLKKGWNRILLQIGSSENTNSNFLISLTDLQHNSIPSLEYSSDYHEYPKLGGEKIELVKKDHLEYLEKKADETPDDLAYILPLLSYSYYLGDLEMANELREKIASVYPNSLFSNLIDREYYSMKGNSTLYKKTIENIKNYKDSYPPSLIYFWEEEVSNENMQELKVLYNKMQKYPEYYSEAKLQQFNMIMQMGNGEYQEGFQNAIKSSKKYPRNVEFLSIALTYYLEVTKDYEKAISELEYYLEENNNINFVVLLASLISTHDDFEDGVELLKKYHEIFPFSPKIAGNISDMYYNKNMFSEAADYINQYLELAPYNSFIYQKLANIYQQNGNKDKAKINYEKSIEYYPLNYESRKKLALLNDAKSLFERLGEPNLDSIYNSSKTDIDENLVVLHNEVKSIAYENGGFEQKYYYLYKAMNSQGVDMLKEYSIDGYGNQRFNVEEAKLIKPDGTQIKAEQNGAYLVFPGMEVGDAIKVVYQQWTYSGYSLTNHFWDKFYFAFGYPGENSKYTLAVEGNKKFSFELANNDTLKPVKSKIDDFDIYTWEMNNIKEYKSESYMPELHDIASVLYISSIPDWSFIVDWYDGLTKNRIKEDKAVTKKLNELLKKDLSDLEKVKLAYNYILEDIRYSSVSFRQSGFIPQKSKKLIDERLGDCKDLSTLLVNFCNELGVDANLVLVKTRDNGMNSLVLPSINFNHCAVEINLEGKQYFVETTNEFLSFGNISEGMVDQQILPIKKESKSIVPLDFNLSTTKNKVFRDTQIQIGMDESIVDKTSIKYGGRASSMRGTYKYLNEDEKMKTMEKAIIEDDPSLSLKSLDFISGLNEVSDSIIYKYQYTMSTDLLQVGDMYVYKLDWTDKFYSTDIVAPKERKTPIELYKYARTQIEDEKIEIILPENFSASELPKNVNISNDLFDYNQEFSSEGGKVICKRYFEFKKRIIQPEEYPAFKEGIEKIVKSDKTNIIIKAS